MDTTSKEIAEQLGALLGSYKAEWLSGKLFDLFTEPGYFSQLKSNRPCVLIGGRGTGKTTVLRGLSYEGQFAFANGDARQTRALPFVGLYYRVNTNRVTAFRGGEISEEGWTRLFGHYINLTFCRLVLDFVGWYQRVTGTSIDLPPSSISAIRVSLQLPTATTLSELREQLNLAILSFENAVNNVADANDAQISMLGAPIDELTGLLANHPEFVGKQFFFLIDEFENFEDYQQRILNTIIKHATTSYTFKVGVRELGWRDKRTLIASEILRHPADYVQLSIRDLLGEGDRFKTFAEAVLYTRIRGASVPPQALPESLQAMLPTLSDSAEVTLLEGSDLRDAVIQGAPTLRSEIDQLSEAEIFFLRYWAKTRYQGNLVHAHQWKIESPDQWKTAYGNHFQAALFGARRNTVGVRKYYCGWDTFLKLSDGNIRFLMELVHTSVLLHLENNPDLATPIGPRVQTNAAIAVGQKNLAELEGLSVRGAKLERLLLALGRVFGVLASIPEGHTPEINQFHVGDDSPLALEQTAMVQELLDLSVMHLALVRFHGNKLLDASDIRAFEYMVHPIFAPFFVFSHRRKRKLVLSEADLLNLISKPKPAIREILARHQRNDSDIEPPDQLQLFKDFYAGT